MKNDIPTLSVNGKVIKYNAEFVKAATALSQECAGARGHALRIRPHGRLGEREHKRWNHAGDYVINDILKDATSSFGDGWLQQPGVQGMSTDDSVQPAPA